MGRGTVEGDSDKNVEPDEVVRPREKWANKMEFIFSMIGFLFDMPQITRFSIYSHLFGGVTFLYTYCICLFFIGMPMLFLETALGQYTSEGAVTAWRKICPMFQGVGIVSQVIVTINNIYFMVGLSWIIFYLANSFRSSLPWSTCGNEWNTDLCYNSSFPRNFSYEDISSGNVIENTDQSPAWEYWYKHVLRLSDDVSLTVNWHLALCLLLAWVICYFCTWKGIRITGKVVYVTATLPYVLLVILFFRGVTLSGSAGGLKHYFIPFYNDMANISLWVSAVQEVAYSHAVSLGVLTTLGSYNKYKTDCYRDCWIVSCLITVTKFFACMVVFSMVGFLHEMLESDLNEGFSEGGVGLLFITFPRILSMLPGSNFWAFLFFTMLFLLVLDNQCLCMDSLATSITDLFPRYLRRPLGREILVLVIAVVSFLLGLPFLTNGVNHLFALTYQYSIITFVIVGLEAVIVSWVYGADRFYDNIEDMIGYKPFPVLKYCWMFIIPVVCWLMVIYLAQSVFTASMISKDALGYEVVFVLLLVGTLICIPAFILVSLYRDAKNMTRSSKDLRQTRPYKPVLTLCKRVIFVGQQRPTRNVEEGNEKLMMEENPSV